MVKGVVITIILSLMLMFSCMGLSIILSERLGKKPLGCAILIIFIVMYLFILSNIGTYKAGVIDALNNEITYDTVSVTPKGKILDIDFYKK